MSMFRSSVVVLLVTFGVAAQSATRFSKVANQFREKASVLEDLSVDPKSDFRKHPNYDLLPNTTVCGISKVYAQASNSTREKRIIGGKIAKLGKFPWFGRLEFFEGSSTNISEVCGLTLINSRYGLTAAHCVTKIPGGYTISSASFGTVDVRKDRQCTPHNASLCTDRKRYDVDSIIIHEDYVGASLINDIALVRFTEPVKFNDFVSPVCLPWDESLLKSWPDSDITAIGFGRATGDDNKRVSHYPNQLRETELPIVSSAQCEVYYKRRTGKIDKSRFCAGGEPERDACRGDSGGPLLKKLRVPELENEFRTVQFGVVSFGHCAIEGVPGGYMNVLYYMPWILDNLEYD